MYIYICNVLVGALVCVASPTYTKTSAIYKFMCIVYVIVIYTLCV